jgi:hypothetical protein
MFLVHEILRLYSNSRETWNPVDLGCQGTDHLEAQGILGSSNCRLLLLYGAHDHT